MASAPVDFLDLYVPTGKVRATGGVRCAHLEELRGRTVGVLDNGKPHGKVLLTAVQDLLVKRYGMVAGGFERKAYPGKKASDESIQSLVKDCDSVVVGIGD